MSWSVNIIGKPDAIIAELERYSQTQSGQSKVEFDAAKPALQELCRQNFRDPTGAPHYTDPVLKLTASGHGSADGAGKQLARYCTASMESVNATIAL